MYRLAALLLAALVALADGYVTYRVVPNDTDPAIRRFNEPHYILFDSVRARAETADLVVFMPGTGGVPGAGQALFLNVAAGQGYRVISLAYNDTPAVVQRCTNNPDPRCSGNFRQKRIFGDNVTPLIDDTPAEAIINRLVKLLRVLDRDHPAQGWGRYLDGDAPRWERIVVAGHSQGAGMAAYIAQRKRVARAVLFSSPWDSYGADRTVAPWVRDGLGATPPGAWFAAYHERENTAALIAKCYQALGIPKDHIRVFTLEPARMAGANPYHISMIGSVATPKAANGEPAYADDWRFLLGVARQ